MEADQLFLYNVVLIFNGLKLFEDSFLAVERRPEREFSSMFAKRALERVGIFDSLLDIHLHFCLIARKVLLEQEGL